MIDVGSNFEYAYSYRNKKLNEYGCKKEYGQHSIDRSNCSWATCRLISTWITFFLYYMQSKF